ncbi:cysteine desulfurase/selenocysteine lyase [Azospirillum brasilense]|uniref:Cysteine desulfurase n=1 Tax=Azospirillum brasilense TaxID=192 RepID=A0A560AUM2_AZOBR|nr:family 2A encapsulin nanocompartment cargo protein cysteine desulfurase [Azospirillum brasilense]TWA63962.1 cysteine desulfurase/selenocysteine lyase [Azospirillum brasilense]
MSAITTTTPDAAAPTLPPSAAGFGGLGPGSGLPDIALIGRLANQFFQALPSGPAPAPPSGLAAAQAPGPLPVAPQPGPAANPSLAALPPFQPAAPTVPPVAGDGGLRSILHSLGGTLSLVPPLPGAATVPSTPVAGAPSLPSGVPYFLDERRDAAASVSPSAVPAAPGHLVDVGALSVQLRAEQVPDLPLPASPAFDPRAARRDFPILNQTVHGKPLIWLDNAATTQKPQAVIDRLARFYAEENSNIHRAAHALAARATDAYEEAREKARRFVGAADTGEIVFVRGATEAINLVAKAWGRQHIREGDEIVVTWLEHHANIVPWQQLCAETGARLRVVPVDEDGQIRLDEYARLLTPRTRLVSLTLVSNALGTVTPAAEMVAMARSAGAVTLVDGAQAVSHMPVNVQSLGCDFFVLSGHKMFGPTGIGLLYGRQEVLEGMQPWQGGGNMIADVTFEKTVYHPAPMRFEAGTGNIADAVGLGAAIDYLDRIGMPVIAAYEHSLLEYATAGLSTVPGLRLIGTARDKAGVLSFVLDGCRTEDVGRALDREGIAVRSGHHCAQPILRRFGVESTVRPSLAFYNTCEDLDALTAALHRIRHTLVRRGH